VRPPSNSTKCSPRRTASLDCSDYDGSVVRTKFWFDDSGGITRTLCVKDGKQAEVA
jgi:hypothetical protein